MKKILILILALFVLVGLAVTVARYMPQRGTGAAESPAHPAEPVSSPITAGGTFVCLPHKDQSGPQTMECAYGMKADDGSYYALDWSATPQSAFDLPMDRPYTVTGTFTPVEALDSDHWQIYDIRGIIRVSDFQAVASAMPTSSVGVPFVLELKKPVKVGDTVITVTAVTEDSRCPADVNCIQAGRVRAVVDLQTGDGASADTTVEPGQSADAGALSFMFDSVAPAKVSTHKIADGEYRFTFTAKNR